MGKPNVRETDFEHLIPDNHNFNAGTEYGEHLMDNSVRRFGCGRSILIDRNNRIIAGNKTFQKAGELGFDRVLVVPTDGKTLVAVQRTDVDLDTQFGRELALADNATSAANLDWDYNEIAKIAAEFNFSPDDWGVDIPDSMDGDDGDEDETKEDSAMRLIIQHKDAAKLSLLAQELETRGFTVEVKE